MNIAIGADHAGYDYKAHLVTLLKSAGHTVTDFGTNGPDSVDYPDHVHPLCKHMGENKDTLGVLVCGSANGVAITANKYAYIRAAICWQKELAGLARQHNNANVVCIPARFVNLETAEDILKTFISTDFEGGRHQNRVDKIAIK